jgi:hypothetical protein
MPDNDFVCVPVSTDLYSKLLERQPSAGVAGLIEDMCWNFLERTQGDFLRPKPKGGVTWGPIFLPYGTKLMMEYDGHQRFAEVISNGISYEGQLVDSPSQLARRIANNTSRNAWRDLWIRRPSDDNWISAQVLRKREANS